MENARRGTIMKVTTVGSDWVPFAPDNGNFMDLINNSDTVIEYRRDGAGLAMPIAAGDSRLIIAISDSSDIEVRRQDGGAPVDVFAELFVS